MIFAIAQAKDLFLTPVGLPLLPLSGERDPLRAVPFPLWGKAPARSINL
jgi:hypothetical protein